MGFTNKYKKNTKGFFCHFCKEDKNTGVKQSSIHLHSLLFVTSSFLFFIPAVRYLFIDHQAAWLSLHAGQL